jgi:hypothetical protein
MTMQKESPGKFYKRHSITNLEWQKKNSLPIYKKISEKKDSRKRGYKKQLRIQIPEHSASPGPTKSFMYRPHRA